MQCRSLAAAFITLLTLHFATGADPGTATWNNPGNDYRTDAFVTSVPVVRGSDGRIYRITDERGVELSRDDGLTWRQRNAGLPRKTIYPFIEKPLRVPPPGRSSSPRTED